MDEQERSGAALHGLLVEIVKAALVPEAEFAASCRARGLAARQDLGPLPRSLDAAWAEAVRAAEADHEIASRETVNPVLPSECPFAKEALSGADFDFDEAARHLRELASFG